MADEAWVTLATNDSYALGALVLAESLKRSGTKKQLHILVTPTVTAPIREQLAKFYAVSDVDVLDSRDEANLALIKRPELGVTFTKLHCWTLTQYKKAVFLDADCLVLRNSDELFEYPELSAAPDIGWPDIFNSGVFVFVPSQDTYHALLQHGVTQGSFDGGDQGLLNTYFNDWNSKGPSNRLPFIYNMSSHVVYTYVAAYKQFAQTVKIVHFLGSIKPWHHNFDTHSKKLTYRSDSQSPVEHIEFWWRLFAESILPSLHPELAAQSIGEVQAAGDRDHQAAWERGNIEYMGRDAWEHIQKRLDESSSK